MTRRRIRTAEEGAPPLSEGEATTPEAEPAAEDPEAPAQKSEKPRGSRLKPHSTVLTESLIRRVAYARSLGLTLSAAYKAERVTKRYHELWMAQGQEDAEKGLTTLHAAYYHELSMAEARGQLNRLRAAHRVAAGKSVDGENAAAHIDVACARVAIQLEALHRTGKLLQLRRKLLTRAMPQTGTPGTTQQAGVGPALHKYTPQQLSRYLELSSLAEADFANMEPSLVGELQELLRLATG